MRAVWPSTLRLVTSRRVAFESLSLQMLIWQRLLQLMLCMEAVAGGLRCSNGCLNVSVKGVRLDVEVSKNQGPRYRPQMSPKW